MDEYNETSEKIIEAEVTEHDETTEETHDFSPLAQPQKKQRGHSAGVIALSLAAAIIGGALGSGATAALMSKSGKAVGISPSISYAAARQIDKIQVDTSNLLTDSEIYRANVASTVGITTSITTTNFWGFQTQGAASGSGFIYTDDGYILTNYHVVESSTSITVTTNDNMTYDASIVGYDESNDIAVLKINAENLIPVVIGNSSTLEIGDHVVAIGNPLGELTFSLTQGAVSSLDRAVTFSTGGTMKLIQTDCAINSGNSGGALFNTHGEVIGITNAKYSSSSSGASIDNIGFAIPINNVIGIVDSIIERGYISKPYIGVTVATVSAEAQQFGVPAGASIQGVVEGSPAEKAGLLQNDIITAVDGKAITVHSELVAIVGSSAPGDVLELTVYRSGETITLNITIGETQQDANAKK